MAKLSAKAKKQIMSWIDKLEDGDTIRINGGSVFIYNSSGCEIDSTL
jgi:hypothetical protein